MMNYKIKIGKGKTMGRAEANAFLMGVMHESLTEKQMNDTGINTCPTCQKPYMGFVDDLSLKEYKISGMCQSCQDSAFGKPDLPDGLPTGKCPNCGNMCYNHDQMCSKRCEVSYMAYLNSN
jgi:hypothetical protein